MPITGISLAAQLAELNQPAPVDIDPEDAAIVGAHSQDKEPSNAGREHYLDVGPSALRKLQDSVSDPKYEGVRISRTELEQSDHTDAEPEAEPSSSDDVPDDQPTPVTSEDESSQHEHEDALDGDNEQPPTQARHRQAATAHTPQLKSGSLPHPQPENDLASTLKRSREEERKKGKAVTRQLAMYDSLLDARIRLQKCVSNMNRLPDSTHIPDYLIEKESQSAVNTMLSEALSLAEDLFDLQETLLSTNENIDPPARKRQKTTSEDKLEERDWEEELQELSRQSAELESTLHPYLLTTLKKWSNKVLAIAPNALLPSNRTKFSKSNANQVKSAVQLIDEALLDSSSLVNRTRVWRGTAPRLSTNTKKESAENDPENMDDIFDDTDFYQALLRDVIDSRSGAAAGDPLSADWRLTQKQRKKAKSATVDTRASKGRKLRFEVHEKLRNFMAPGPPPPPSLVPGVRTGGGAVWHEAQIDELFASLLGRVLVGDGDGEVVGGRGENGESVPGSRPMDIDVAHAVKGGFRVFG